MRQLSVYVHNPAVCNSFLDFFNLFFILFLSLFLHLREILEFCCSQQVWVRRLCTFPAEAPVFPGIPAKELYLLYLKQNHVWQLSYYFFFVPSPPYPQVKFLKAPIYNKVPRDWENMFVITFFL